ncbi:c-type cytochrome [Seonamhaeicola maritimus]|uniref:C-type cytochrome n=1 Tax=Seonamhaeicola maritimus TaxID=2591822 RepID=A0A5C7GEI4_9FLAO|nr:c-type cytochrome [Seonamhaeicola maritimus]
MSYKSFFLLTIISGLLSYSCKPKTFDEPQISLDKYQIEEGFNIEVVASEPFIEAPVAMDFDNQGRMWVVEMKGYMRNLSGAGDDEPNGTISILEDLDNDGITDHAKVFIDSLVLPRAIAHVYGGLLYAEPPNLWFVNIDNDKPLNKVLVDSLYSEGGNVEHQPNGLMMHIDNWIYNAKSYFRYQRKEGNWIKEPTTFRGQWGISKDNFGRLYYNTNSVQLLGDYMLPNTLIKNKFYKPKTGLNNVLTPDQRVYPLHPTSVNRGYVKGVLDKDSLLINVTSACGPLIYRGNQFPKAFKENAFVCVPEANIVKRNILTFEADKVSGSQAKANVEFLAATEEGFRPVNLNNGPDGNLYIVDMHRGVIQDRAFMTPYMRDALAKKKLDTLIGKGRILKVARNNNSEYKPIDLSGLEIKELVSLLENQNGWLRDRAQQVLIHENDESAISLLKVLLFTSDNEIAQIHALHTLNGLDALKFKDLEKVLTNGSSVKTQCHGLVLSGQFASEDTFASFKNILERLSKENHPEIDLYMLSSLDKWFQVDAKSLFPLIYEVSSRYKEKPLYQEALVSSLGNVETEYLNYIREKELDDYLLNELLNEVIVNRENKKQNSIYTRKKGGTDSRTSGYRIYRNLCATCHGVEGEGVESLAPPLVQSEYISGSSERLALVLLHGLSGPVHVDGKVYDFNITMPGLVNNPDFTDKDVLDVMKYLKSAFAGEWEEMDVEKLKSLRELKPENGSVFTEKELKEIIK